MSLYFFFIEEDNKSIDIDLRERTMHRIAHDIGNRESSHRAD